MFQIPPAHNNPWRLLAYLHTALLIGLATTSCASRLETDPTSHTSTASSCRANQILKKLGRSTLLVGANMTLDTAVQAPFDLRSVYLAGGLPDVDAPCTTCNEHCSVGAKPCSEGEGCAWWGCWQWDELPPGQFVRGFLETSQRLRQLPMVTYYQLLQTSGSEEGPLEVAAVQDVPLMIRYFNDWRFFLEIIGENTAILHIEPDFWAFVQQTRVPPSQLPAAVATANPRDCGTLDNSVAGMGRCLIAMVRTYAPNALVGLHASGWGTGVNAPYNRSDSFDVTLEAVKTANFLRGCGADEADIIVVDVSDRDAGFSATLGKDTWWDSANEQLPHYHQGFRWARALSDALGLPVLWWHLPVGQMSLPNTPQRWQDNRVAYFFDHPDEVAATCAIGMSFGAGLEGQTTPETDGGHLIERTRAYFQAGGQPPTVR